MEETIVTITAQPFLGEDWFEPLETRFVVAFAGSPRFVLGPRLR
jgi:hypothetical protein